MNKIQKAKELLKKAQEIRGSRTQFLLEVAQPIREEIRKIKFDPMLSYDGKLVKTQELKQRETPKFMEKLALRKSEYQHHLSEAKKLANSFIEESFITADDGTKARFNRDFSELKFKLALHDGNTALREVEKFANNIKQPEYAQLFLDGFYEIAGKFNEADGDLKVRISRLFDKVKTDFTPEEVVEAQDIIEYTEQASKNRMFTIMMPGDNPSQNPEYSIISELFTDEAVRYYQEPETYFEAKQETIPTYEPPKPEVTEKPKKSPTEQAYDNLYEIMRQKKESGEI